jgi:hypothetical protein
MEAECRRGHIGAKLGFVRLSFAYFISDEAFEYILEAIHLLADQAWKLLPLYRFDPDSGLWHHRDHHRVVPTLADAHLPCATRESGGALARHLEQARQIVRAVESARANLSASDPVVSEGFERLRWFPLPGEALATLRESDAA